MTDPVTRTWLDVEGSEFGARTLPYGVFERDGEQPRVGVAVGHHVLDVSRLDVPCAADFATASLNAFMSRGRAAWREVRARLLRLLTVPSYQERVLPHLLPAAQVRLRLPFEVADYVDFYSSEHHASNVGRMFRPDGDPLTPNWRHLPVGYHGRAGTVVVSGTPVRRPCGQRKAPHEAEPAFGASRRLDIEAEVGFVVGVGSSLGTAVAAADVAEHVFGVVLVNDWSARDIQAWEYVPLGPFLGKSFATSISAWVVPLEALEPARVAPPEQRPPPLPYLRCDEPWGLDLALEIDLNGTVVSRPPFAGMYWTVAQQLAHLTVNGAALRTGDLFASGTVSGPSAGERGSLLELSWNGSTPVRLDDGSTRTFLDDGDTVIIRADARDVGGERVSLGHVAGTIMPAMGG